MATLRKRNGKWQAQVRIHGAKPISRTFYHKQDAERWGRETEIEVQRGSFRNDAAVLGAIKLSELIIRYRDTVSPRKRWAANETILLNALLRQPFATQVLSNLSPKDFSEYRDARAKTKKASTINHELTALSHIFRIAKHEWGIPIENPLHGIRRPKADLPRTRRLQKGEWAKLMDAATKCRNKLIRPIIEFAVETGMRRSEILNICSANVDTANRVLSIPLTKNGEPRKIALTEKALSILKACNPNSESRLFPLTMESFKLAWQRLVKRSGIIDLHFHDLRHEAVSRFFEMGLSVPEVALMSGHKDYRMLARYTHLRAEDIAYKLMAEPAHAHQ